MIGSSTQSRGIEMLWLAVVKKEPRALPTESMFRLPFCAELRVAQIVTALVSCWWCICVTAESLPLLKSGVFPDMIRLSPCLSLSISLTLTLTLLLSLTEAQRSVFASALGLNKTTTKKKIYFVSSISPLLSSSLLICIQEIQIPGL